MPLALGDLEMIVLEAYTELFISRYAQSTVEHGRLLDAVMRFTSTIRN